MTITPTRDWAEALRRLQKLDAGSDPYLLAVLTPSLTVEARAFALAALLQHVDA